MELPKARFGDFALRGLVLTMTAVALAACAGVMPGGYPRTARQRFSRPSVAVVPYLPLNELQQRSPLEWQ